MLIAFFARGLIIGLAIAAPVGPIGVLCIRRTLAAGGAIGFVSGLGAATADASYGAVAAFGLTALGDFLTGHEGWLRLIGGIFLCYLGLRTMVAAPAPDDSPARTYHGFAGAYASVLGLTLTNPLTILSFAAIFAGIGLGTGGGNPGAAGLIVAGVFLGSALWWFTLASLVNLARRRLAPSAMRWVNRFSGAIIATFGSIALLSLIASPSFFASK